MKDVVPMKRSLVAVVASWVFLLTTTTTISPTVAAAQNFGRASAADRKLRHDFLHSMKAGPSADQMDRELQRQLLSMATPVEKASPEDLASSSKLDFSRQLGKWDDDNTGIDLKDYAFKYIGCQNVHTFSDDKAADKSTDSVFVMNRFVVLRLCPAEYCSNYNPTGCQYGYGEYMIAMEDYLSAMARYHYVRYQSFCETCDECMNPSKDAANDDYGDQGGNRRLANDASTWLNATGNETDYSYCEYYHVCFNYKDACKYYSSSAEQYESFFSCAANPYGYNKGYLGPHCRNDGYTIGIGLYLDSDCGDYIGDVASIEQYTGLSFNDSVLEIYTSNSCISCMDADEFDLYTDDGHGDSVYQLCGVLWDGSAKCNTHLARGDNSYDTVQQASEADLVCEFIESLVEKNYDEYGHIVLQSESFDLTKWKDKNEYIKFVRRANAFQIACLAVSIVICQLLLGYAWYLRNKLRKRMLLWKPSLRQPIHPRNASISRINSGITMERSFSGETFFRKGNMA